MLIEPIGGQCASAGIDMFLLMCFGGGECTVDELAALGTDCGLALRSHGPVADGRTVLGFVST